MKWDVLKELVNTLKVFYQATIVMQKNDFKLSDFYATYIFMETKLTKMMRKQSITQLAKHLFDMLSKRKNDLISNSSMIAALALDPRFCAELGDAQKRVALDSLENLWKRLNNSVGEEQVAILNDSNTSNDSDGDITINKTTILKVIMKRKNLNIEPVAEVSSFNIRDALLRFMSHDHDITEGTILDFWNLKQKEYPKLYELAEVILAISPTQAMVERSFSVLNHVFNNRRNRLGANLLENILFISLNEDLFKFVNNQDINALN